jgi:uncharacterized protein (DUF697 family)
MHNLSNEYYQQEFMPSMNEYSDELAPEFEFENGYSGETAYELDPEFDMEGPDMETSDQELVQELMGISNEMELGAWLKKVGKKAAGGAVNFLRSPTGMKATAALGNIAKKTLPGLGGKVGAWAGGKIGGFFGNEGLGRRLGQQVGTRAGTAAADQYPNFVRFATDTLDRLSREYETGNVPAVKPAIVAAAKRHYPVVLRIDLSLPGKRRDKEFEFETNDEFDGEANYEMEGEISHDETTFNEITEMELASELLNIQNEMELDQFIGKLFKRAVGAARNFAKSSTGRALGGMLKGLAKKALPIAGKALGSFIAPGIGTAIGGALGTAASNLFELELEGLSAEDREFETARAFVRFAGNSAKRATTTRAANPAAAARTAIVGAAKGYAPGLLAKRGLGGQRRGGYRPTYNQGTDDIGNATTGTWHKVNGRIILSAD